jgi:hypothetical protein
LSAEMGKTLDVALTAETGRATTAEATKIAKADAFTGDVTGTYNATVIAANAVDYSKLKGISADGTDGQVLATDGSGKLKWVNQTTAISVEDALTSTSTSNALSANQGNVLSTTKEDVANKSTDVLLDASSDTKYPSVKAVKTYVETTVLVDATETTKGIIQLAGDLAGSALGPRVADGAINTDKIANGAVDYTKLAGLGSDGQDGQVVATDGAGQLRWVTPIVTTVVNDLTTGGTNSALSAEMGKTLDTNKLDKTATFDGAVRGTYDATTLAADAVITNNIKDQSVTAQKLSGITSDGNSGEVLASNGGGALKWVNALTTTLSDGKILVGDGSNVATAVAPSGDVTISNAGVTSIGTGKVVTGMIAANAVDYSKLAGISADGTDGQILATDGSGSLKWVNQTPATTVEDVLTSTSGSNALSAKQGKVLNDGKLDKTAIFGGDVTGTYNATVVEKIQGTAVSSTAPSTTGQVLSYDGSQWAPTAIQKSIKGRIACTGALAQVVSNTNVTATCTIILSYEDPNDGEVISVAVGSRVANTSFKVLFGSTPPTSSYINYTILP